LKSVWFTYKKGIAMLVPLAVDYREVEKTAAIDELIRRKAEKLDHVCDHITSCRVIIEKVQKHWHTHQKYHVRLDITVPPGHEIVISHDGGRSAPYLELEAEIRWAFESAEEQLKELVERQSGDVKKHPFQEVQGVIERISQDMQCGFIRSTDGREIYFHRNSVIHHKFDDLKPGVGVRFSEEEGVKGPQASSVKIVDTPESY
jgi:cold shock CspA family protein